jgi:Uma2 family endonuclease
MSQTIQRIESQWYDEAQLPPKWRMTEEEFVEWYDRGDIKAEWVDGEVIVMAPISDVHDQLQWWLRNLLQFYVDRKKLGRVFGPQYVMRLAKERSRREPDIFFVVAERARLITRNHMEGPVDLAVEVVSPESRKRDRQQKYKEYQAAGVREYWIVDPLSKSVDVFALNSAGKYEAIAVVDAKIESKVVAGWFVRPAWLWTDPLIDVHEALNELGIR